VTSVDPTNGTGIAPEMLSGVFEMFTQVDRSLEPPPGGPGIGLTLVRRLVKMRPTTAWKRSRRQNDSIRRHAAGQRLAEVERLRRQERRSVMLRWALLFLVIALIAGVFGFWGLEGLAMWIAKVLFVLFLILFIVSLVMGRRGTPIA
jgi:uncharacterized membrane protein YtjA (UPF0391 family)